jgi:hypothetical protein
MNWKPDLKFLCGYDRYMSRCLALFWKSGRLQVLDFDDFLLYTIFYSSIFMMFVTAVTARNKSSLYVS